MPIIETNGIKFNYEERGSGDPLICIMGVTAPGGVWDAHAQAWEKHFRCMRLITSDEVFAAVIRLLEEG